MIRKDEALAFLRKQLALVEGSLADLRREVKNERNFQVLSEGYVDQIADLKAEIAKYEHAAKDGSANPQRKHASQTIETFGGPFHRFETVFRPQKAATKQAKRKTRPNAAKRKKKA